MQGQGPGITSLLPSAGSDGSLHISRDQGGLQETPEATPSRHYWRSGPSMHLDLPHPISVFPFCVKPLLLSPSELEIKHNPRIFLSH
jgi:hypothetical protein